MDEDFLVLIQGIFEIVFIDLEVGWIGEFVEEQYRMIFDDFWSERFGGEIFGDLSVDLDFQTCESSGTTIGFLNNQTAISNVNIPLCIADSMPFFPQTQHRQKYFRNILANIS